MVSPVAALAVIEALGRPVLLQARIYKAGHGGFYPILAGQIPDRAEKRNLPARRDNIWSLTPI
jgi:hypothetical protein